MSAEHKLNLSKSHSGKVFTDEHKNNISKRVITKEWRDKLSKANTGKILENHSEKIKSGFTDESRKKISEAMKNSPLKKCPYCNKECRGSNYSRWHGENCKEKHNGV